MINMQYFKKFKRKMDRLGFADALKFSFKHFTGIRKREDEIKALYYVMNHCIDITRIPPAKGVLRKLQLCDAVLLNIFALICGREGWNYWLAYGTLLGAVRHKGFIPWDDDMDIVMPRKDFISVRKRLPEILREQGITEFSVPHFEDDGMWFHYKDGIWIDINPADIINSGSDDEAESRENIQKILLEWKKFFYANKKRLSPDELDAGREKIISIYADRGGGTCCLI